PALGPGMTEADVTVVSGAVASRIQSRWRRGSSSALKYSSPSGPIAVTCVIYSMEVRGVARLDNDAAGRIGFHLVAVKLFTETNIENAGHHRVNAGLRGACAASASPRTAPLLV